MCAGPCPDLQARFLSGMHRVTNFSTPSELGHWPTWPALPELVTQTDQVTEKQSDFQLCEVPRTQVDLMSGLGMSHRTFFRARIWTAH